MPTFQVARTLAESWVRAMSEVDAELVKDATIARPYGWVFFYQSRAHLQNPSDFSSALVGNAPILVDKVDCEIRVLGTARPVEWYLAEYEKGLPPARLQMKVEAPQW